MSPHTKKTKSAEAVRSSKRGYFGVFKNWTNTSFGVVVTISALILVTEFMIMELSYSLSAPLIAKGIPTEDLNYVDPVVLTFIISLALYFLVFKRIRADAEKFLNITEAAEDAIVTMGPNGRITFWNTAAERIFGYTQEEAVGQQLHELLSLPADRSSYDKGLPTFLETGKGPILARIREVEAVRKNGEVFPAELSVSATKVDGQWYSIGVMRDITERKTREKLLHERDEELARINLWLGQAKAKDEAILESLGEGMIATDKLGNIITVNRTAEKITGWSKDELVNKKMVDMIPAVNEAGGAIPPEKRPVSLVIETGLAIASQKLHIKQKNRKMIPVEITATPIVLNEELLGAVLVLRDITKEEELEITRRDLLSLASHQLRTPLSGTKWLIEGLKRGVKGVITEGQEKYLDELEKTNERMISLVHDMLGVLRMEGDITQAKKEDVSIPALFGTLFDTLGGAAGSKNIKLELIKDDYNVIQSDCLLLRQILESLISNAINYSNPDSTVVIKVEKNNNEVIFSVKDTGIGIPRDEQMRLFERFYRATNAQAFDTNGTGLGLYIAATLAKKLGGQLTFESEENKGSTFYLKIPVKHD